MMTSLYHHQPRHELWVWCRKCFKYHNGGGKAIKVRQRRKDDKEIKGSKMYHLCFLWQKGYPDRMHLTHIIDTSHAKQPLKRSTKGDGSFCPHQLTGGWVTSACTHTHTHTHTHKSSKPGRLAGMEENFICGAKYYISCTLHTKMFRTQVQVHVCTSV